MKKMFQTGTNPVINNFWLLALRFSVAGFMLSHGIPKLLRLFEGGEIKFGDPIGLGQITSLLLAVFAEFLCSILIGIGLFTRVATIPLIITMSVAAFIVHGPDPFGRKELALLYLIIYITLMIFGSGKYSLDYFIFDRKSNQ